MGAGTSLTTRSDDGGGVVEGVEEELEELLEREEVEEGAGG
jgi:hypothetical protein